MPSNDIPLLSMLKSRLGYLNERQKLIAQNVANSDTPGYAPKELKAFEVHLAQPGSAGAGALALAPVATAGGHFTGLLHPPADQPYTPNTTADSEIKLDGNKVVLEEEMIKMNDARMNYSATIDFYEKSLSMLQLAIRSPGKST
jgi:flagellar basal-body rod protein FlgB